MSTILIAGASGVVGHRALHHAFVHPEVDCIIAIGRRDLPLRHEKLVSPVVNLTSKASVAEHVPGDAVAALCCLGTTMKTAGSKQAFRAVDHDAVVAFAEAAFERRVPRFVLVSSIGADPESRNFYLKTKGETERAVVEVGFRQVTILRPSFIDDQGTRGEYRPAERLLLPIARAVFAVIGKNSRYAPITADDLGKAMIRLAFDDVSEAVRILEGTKLRAAPA